MLRGQELVDYVNKVQTSFKAELGSYFSSYPDTIKKQLMGAKMVEIPEEYRVSKFEYFKDFEKRFPKNTDFFQTNLS